MHSLIKALPRTAFTTPGTGTPVATDVLLAKLVDTSPFVSLSLILRVHAWTAGSWIVLVRAASFAEDDPSTFFTAGATGQISQTVSAAAPNLIIAAFTAPVPSHVSVLLTQPGVTNGAVTLSLDLLGRDA